MERKRILFIVEAMGGGVFTYIVDLSNALIEKYDIFIAYAVRNQTPINFQKSFNKKIQLIEVKNFNRSINLIKDLKAFFEIKEIARSIQPDVIHLHSSKAGILGRWAFNGHKIPLYYTPHGYSFLMEDQGYIKRQVYRIAEYISAQRPCITISCSRGEHEETLKLTKKALYVNNGINMEELDKLINFAETKKKSEFTVFTVGRICYQKNPWLFNQVASQMPDIKFLWIGDGELKNELIAENIEVTGWLDRKKVVECACSGDVFMLTSLWEGLPISLLEAMYMRKFCIVSNVIGNRDVIHSGENGIVCKNAEEFIWAIKFAKEKHTEKMIERALYDIKTKYNTKTMAKIYSNIYWESICKM